MESVSIQEMLDAVESLSLEDQEQLIDVVRQRLIEKRRIEIARYADNTHKSFQNGIAQVGTIDDLKDDLMGSA